MTRNLPLIAADTFARVTPRQWWLYFEITEPKPLSALTAASGIVEASVRSHLNVLVKQGVVYRAQGSSKADVLYERAVSLSADQEATARKKIASKGLTLPRSAQRLATPPGDQPLLPPTSQGFREGSSSRRFEGTVFVVALLIDLVIAGLAAGTADSTAGRVLAFVGVFLVAGIVLILVGDGILTLLASPDEKAAAKASAEARLRALNQIPEPRAGGRTPLRSWRGFAFMTKAAMVEAYCARCRCIWHIPAASANTIADAQNLANRLIRGGTKAEQFGATLTLGASGRRIAAGNESDRHSRDLAMTLALAACPTCGSVNKVHLTK